MILVGGKGVILIKCVLLQNTPTIPSIVAHIVEEVGGFFNTLHGFWPFFSMI